MTRKEIMPGVYLTYINSKKFKTNYLRAHLVTPLQEKTASLNALLPSVLRRGTARYPDMVSFSKALDLLYGASVVDSVRKKAESQCIGFVASFIDDCYTPGGEKLLESVADILGDLICAPAMQNGSFVAEYVESEKENLIDEIRGQINEKRSYAAIRLLEEMCDGEPYGINRLGSETAVAAITPDMLYAHYLHIVSVSDVELFYCGSAEEKRVTDAFSSAFGSLRRSGSVPYIGALAHAAKPQPKYVTEEMEVSQGKLSIGFACSAVDYPAMLMTNMLFGGSSTSKLFMNVREKLSLCYFASSTYHRQKGLITVSAGIEFENYQKAFDEIMLQLEAVKNGDVKYWEMEGARSNLLNTLRSMEDSAGQLEDFYLGQAVSNLHDTPESLVEEVKTVDIDRIKNAAKTITLDTVYFLKGNGKEEGKD